MIERLFLTQPQGREQKRGVSLQHGVMGQAEVGQGGEHQPVLENTAGWRCSWRVPEGEPRAAGGARHAALTRRGELCRQPLCPALHCPHQPHIFPVPWDHSSAETGKRVFPGVVGPELALDMH